MLDDLQELSRSYEAEKGQAIRRGDRGNLVNESPKMQNPDGLLDIRYEDSWTHQQHQQAARGQGLDDPYNPGGYQPQVSYSTGGVQPSYMASSRPEYPQTPAGAYAGSQYASGPIYPQGPSYATGSAYPGVVRPSTQESYNAPYDLYGDESPHPPYPGGPRREARVEPRADPRESRLDPRADLRRPDPRVGYVPDPRADPRDMRTDSRMLSNYSYPAAPSADVPMRGYNDDYATPSVQMGRGSGPYASSRVVQTGYDPRESPQMRDAYRHEPIREERRSRR